MDDLANLLEMVSTQQNEFRAVGQFVVDNITNHQQDNEFPWYIFENDHMVIIYLKNLKRAMRQKRNITTLHDLLLSFELMDEKSHEYGTRFDNDFVLQQKMKDYFETQDKIRKDMFICITPNTLNLVRQYQ
jgi:hypothetical protein